VANFIAVVDRNGDRRNRFLQTIRNEIAPVDSLRIDSVEVADFGAVWAVSERAPISAATSTGASTVIWGDAIPGPGPERLDATRLYAAWHPRERRFPRAFDGFYAAVCYDEMKGLVVGADLLGLFPVYYAATADVIIVGSSPELFRRHPGFPAELSREGLTGLLLVHAPLDGRVLLSGVQRLEAGHVLRWREGKGASEVLQFEIPVPSQSIGGSFDDHLAILDAASSDAINRHLPPNENVGLMLTGGRDSRQIAGYLRERGDKFRALTLGDATDLEVRCASAVARRLDVPHSVKSLDYSEFPANAERQAKWEQLGSGFLNLHMWSAVGALRELPPRVVSGYLRDIREIEPMPSKFDDVLGGTRHRGFPVETLRRLLKRDLFDELIVKQEARLRQVYEEACVLDRQRATRFFLAHDWRSHAGGVPWKLSFGSWPVLPILDRALLEVLFALPDESLFNRRAEEEIIRRRFPDLARVPVDRNSYDTLPLLPSPAQRIRHRLGAALEPIRRRFPRRTERRYFHRIYDINNPGWSAVRRRAEPHRERLGGLMDMDVLRKLVPPPGETIPIEHKVRDGVGTKELLGLMLWSADHL